MGKETQKDIVYEIVKQAGSRGIRTELVTQQGFYKGISESSRYLRWLQQEGKVKGEREKGDRTYTWRIVNPAKDYFVKKESTIHIRRPMPSYNFGEVLSKKTPRQQTYTESSKQTFTEEDISELILKEHPEWI